ncbi:hypothetical protein Vadar_001600 [Vaccinium darrowii]|uniref:Uncharacterized protein n=1 Tax=Vaccinium darrowii TaxID=229202 RepID=A0ACB7ZHP7_9ERIC|nr:hypothetical protein Vadar_001600 [Vaccinium darrowii]
MDESPCANTWLPLEANPDVMNQFLWGLGLPENEAECYDVYGFDEELLEMVPKLVLAVLFLYPMTAKTEEERILQDSERKFFPDGGRLIQVPNKCSSAPANIAGVHSLIKGKKRRFSATENIISPSITQIAHIQDQIDEIRDEIANLRKEVANTKELIKGRSI